MTKNQLFTMRLALIASLTLVPTANAHAQAKKVTYGKSTFTLNKPLPDLAPLPPCGLKPATPGYKIKNPLWGPGTYSPEAPGTVPLSNYKCILTEMRDWVFLREDAVKELAAKKGLKQVVDISKQINNSVFQGNLTYQLSETAWIAFVVNNVFTGKFAPEAKIPINSDERYVTSVSFIEKVPAETSIVLDRMYRFWNDGVQFAEFASVSQKNHGDSETYRNSFQQNPIMFTISDYLLPNKGFFVLSFENGLPPVYVWHSYEKIVTANLKKPKFGVSGAIAHSERIDHTAAFVYGILAQPYGKDIYFQYSVEKYWLYETYSPFNTAGWKNTLPDRKKAQAMTEEANEKGRAQAMGGIGNYNIQMEKMYIEVFK
jgi:hypothetical protein